MFGFIQVTMTDHELAAFVKKHDLFHTSANGATNWKKRGAMDYTHAVVIYDNSELTRKIYINAEVWEAEQKKKADEVGLAGYICFYNREQHEVRAESSLKAQEAAREHFQKKFPRRKVKGYDIAVVIAERADGTPVVHNPGDL